MLLLIERNTTQRGGLRPEAEAALSAYGSEKFYHLEYGLRPPIGQYRTSLSQIWPKFILLLNTLDNIQSKSNYEDSDYRTIEDDLMEKERQLLYCLHEHLEDCENILQCCFPKKSNFGKLKQVKLYRSTVDAYKDFIGRIVNRIKHNQARLRHIIFYGESWVSPGYFVEGVLKDGSLGPDPIVHNAERRAFSFAYDLRYHFISIYYVSMCLAKVISSVKGLNSANDVPDAKADDEIFEIAERLEKANRIIFPDEEKLPYPVINAGKKNHIKMIRLFIIPPGSAPMPIPEYFKVHVSYRGDGISRRFVIPYSNLRIGKESK